MYLDATVSPLGAGLIYVTSTARVLYAMSKIGYMPAFLSRLSPNNFPVFAIFTNFAVGMFLFLPLPGWQAMVSFLVSAMVISYAIGPVALLCLRLELPLEKRKFRLPCPKLICSLAFYFCNLLSYWTGWDTVCKLALAIGLGFIFFTLAYLRGKLDASTIGFKAALWLGPYLGGLTLISYYGAFGGKGYIPFGWDFLVLGAFSMLMLMLAVMTRSKQSAEHYSNQQFLAAPSLT